MAAPRRSADDPCEPLDVPERIVEVVAAEHRLLFGFEGALGVDSQDFLGSTATTR
jgi:hypothetical protein